MKKQDNNNINLDDVMKAVDHVEDNPEASLKMAVLRDKVFTSYPSWFEEIKIPHTSQASVCSGLAAWMQLVKLRKEKKPNVHPVYTIEEIAMSNDIKFANSRIAYINEENKEVILPNTRGYFIRENPTLTLCAAHTADVLAYYTRCDKNGGINNIGDPDTMKRIKMMDVEVKVMRKAIDCKSMSETTARDNIYQFLVEKPEFAYTFCHQICEKTLTYSSLNKDTTLAGQEALKKAGAKYKIDAFRVPAPGSIEVPKCGGDIEKMWRTLMISRSIRGEDDGIGSLTFGYIYGAMPRSITKNITTYLDIVQCCRAFNVNVVLMQGMVSEAVIRILLRNKFFVVSSYYTSGPKLTKKKMADQQYCIYSRMGEGIPYGMFHWVESKPPELNENKLSYFNFDVIKKFNMLCGTKGSMVFHATRVHLNTSMKDNIRQFGLLPAALPHNGQVLCVYPPIKEFTFAELVDRCFISNLVRNNWLISKRLWSVIDPLGGDVGYYDQFIYPKLRMRVKPNMIDLSGDMEKFDVEQVEDIDIKAPAALPNKPLRATTTSGPLSGLVREMLEFGGISEFIIALIVNWGSNKNYIAAVSLALMKVPIEDVIDHLIKAAPKHALTIRGSADQAYAMVKELAEQKANILAKGGKIDTDENDDDDDELGEVFTNDDEANNYVPSDDEKIVPTIEFDEGLSDKI